ncbi:hypothetical protein [Pseudomonas sp. Marseille-QA0892]
MLHFFFMLSAVFFTSAASAEDTALAKTANAIRPAIEAATIYTQKSFLQTMAGGSGPMADGATRALSQLDHHERLQNRGPRRTMQECIKPGSVIDDDVKECMEGLRPRSW